MGKGCKHGPHGVHFHPNNSTKCAYCGSPSFGKGCKINPTSNLHIHGINYNTMLRETLQSSLENAVFLRELKKDYTDFLCYKYGIIDESGNKIKNPKTEKEIASFSPMVKTILKLKKFLGSKLNLIEACSELSKTAALNESIEYYKKTITHRDNITSVINDLYKALDEAYIDGISLDEINNILQA
jgi:hypothetical protein